jgi:hypothetical protein
MPNFDRKGPKGNGSKTGRGLGKCHKTDDELNKIKGRGMGNGRGNGQGHRSSGNAGSGRGMGFRHRGGGNEILDGNAD